MIYIDLDGVMADFDGALLKHNVPSLKTDHKAAWKIIEQIPHFFGSLEVLPGSLGMVGYINSVFGGDWDTVQFLTAIPIETGFLTQSHRDKVDWVHCWVNPYAQVNCVSGWRRKEHFVYNKYDVLIDDMQRNIDAWNNQGGIGILHTSVENTLAQLKELPVVCFTK